MKKILFLLVLATSMQSIWAINLYAQTSWLGPDTLEFEHQNSSGFSAVAIDEAGNIMAAWNQGAELYTARYGATTGWEPKELFDTSMFGDGLFLPTIDMNADGSALLVWSGQRGLYASIYLPNSGWQTPEVIASGENPFLLFADRIQVAIDSSGNGLVLFSENQRELFSSRFIKETGWSTPEVIGDRDFASSAPSLAMNPDGNAVFLWEDWNFSEWNIHVSRFDTAVGWQPAEILHTSRVFHTPKVAIDESGGIIAIYVDLYTFRPEHHLYASRFIPGQGWQPKELVSSTFSPTDPSIAADRYGNATVIWRTSFDKTLTANRYLADSGWQGVEVLRQFYVGDPGELQVKMDALGNVVALWKTPCVPSTIETMLFLSSDGWQEEVQLSVNKGVATEPALALNSNRSAVVVWAENYQIFDGQFFNTFHDIYASRLSSEQPTDVANINLEKPQEFVLFQNYPNPFNPTTEINYKIATVSNVQLTIYNQLGQRVRTLVNERQPVGPYQIRWDGRNDKGESVASGVYLYKLVSTNFIQIKKMLLLR